MSAKPRRVSLPHAPPVMDWLGRDPRSGTILATVQQLLQAQRVVRTVLPGAMGAACQVASIEGGKITLLAPSAAHAAKLRQMSPAICRALARKGWAIAEVRIKITLQAPQGAAPGARHGVALGERGLQAFSDLASSLPPGPLADAVQRLLHHHRSEGA